MRLFWKIFTAVFLTMVGAVFIIAYFTTLKQIKDAEQHLVANYTTTGDFISREIEHYQVESRWPFDRLNRLAKQQGFLFWWVVREDGVIHLADQTAMMGTNANDYFPQVTSGASREKVLLNWRENYGLFITPLEIGKKQWTFWLGFSLTQIWEIKKNIILLSLLISLAASLGLGTVLYLAIGHLVKPIADLTLAAASIGKGDLSPRVAIKSRDEIGQLADAFNQMAADLETTTVSRDYMDSILETMPGVLMVVDADASIITTNSSACRILGYAKGELTGKPMTKVLGRDQSLGPNLEKLFEAGDLTNREINYQTKDGCQVPVFLSSTVRRDAAGRISYIVCDALDITEHKKSEAALVESERRFRDLAENSAEWIWEVDPDGKYTYASPVVAELLGYRPEEVLAKHFYDLFHPEDREDLKQGAFRFFAQKLPFRDFINRNINKNGETVWISTSGVPILDEQGNLQGYRGADIDITARRQAEDALRANERFLTTVFASIQDGISILDLDYNIVRVNAAMEQTFPQAMPLVAKKCYTAYHGRSKPCEICPVRRTLETAQAAQDVVIERGAGDEILRYVDLSTFPLIDPASGKMNGVVESVRDITPEKQAEEALRRSEANLRQSQKMEAVGRLAGGVAHDFNNILTALIGYSELLQGKFEPGDPRLNDIEEIHKAAERAASLTRQLLAFSRKQIFAPKVLNLNNLILDLDKMLRRLLSEDIKLVTIPGENLGEVMADPGQMEQVLINLAVNARDAMPRGGVITIETQNVFLDAAYAQKYAEVQPGDYVMLAVSDTGSGLDEASRARIFEPFYTTKELGQGTGLGLSTVHGIIKQSGGHINVYSEVGQGATFKVYLPRLRQPVQAEAAAPVSCNFDRGAETILLVEDEDMVRQVARRILEMHGYTVLEAASGPEALLVSQQTQGPIHLMLTDVVMPGMSGGQTAERLQAERPELKVVFMSGHTENSIVHHGVLDPGVAFIQKPFRSDLLVHNVRLVLDQPPRADGLVKLQRKKTAVL